MPIATKFAKFSKVKLPNSGHSLVLSSLHLASTNSKQQEFFSLYIGYTMKRRGIRDLDHRGNRLFRRPECVARGRLIRFPR